ncbi:MAG TPA: hypothetical protein DGV23_04085 [Stenotrophomonas sp.]|nr:hypothetical protein [Stenotrophomonas sp.]
MTVPSSPPDRRAQLTGAMHAAGCLDPRDWVGSELAEDIPEFARFLLLREVYQLTDAVQDTLADAVYDQPALQDTLKALHEAVAPAALEALLLAYGRALGNGWVMALDHGPAGQGPDWPGWQLMETDAEGAPSGRLVQGLHEDYLDFEGAYQRLGRSSDAGSLEH